MNKRELRKLRMREGKERRAKKKILPKTAPSQIKTEINASRRLCPATPHPGYRSLAIAPRRPTAKAVVQ
jgi:hypothetical protein